MTSYKISNLSSKTPSAEQTKLSSSLKEVKGVESVKLHADKGEVAISCGAAKEPQQDVLKTAVQKAGFTLGAKV